MTKPFRLQRYEGNPILSPNPANVWESAVTTNPGAWHDEAAREVKMLYRASAADVEHKVYLGLATSRDGYHFTRAGDKPAVVPSDGFDGGCVEDPRIVKFGDWYYIVYASRPFPAGQYWLVTPNAAWKPPYATADFPVALRENLSSSGLLITKDFRTFIRAGRITDPTLDDRDAILFPEKINGRFCMLHRPMSWVGKEYGTDHPAIWISFSDDLLKWPGGTLLASPKFPWEHKIGGSTPPIRTPHGWLTIYHAVGADSQYRLGAMLLDLKDPTRVLHRCPDWLIQPEEPYETQGYYKGVIFPCGNVVIDGTLFVYYGGADKYVALATCRLDELLDYLRTCPA
jgi:predicted GH43/DUF377 family glycosyl hydrolase